jgi:hypothetical protein
MFLVDDLLLSPAKGLLAICRRVRQTARQEFEQQQRRIVTNLSELHRLADTNQIGQADFTLRETDLLERLEKIQEMLSTLEEEEG